MPDPVANEMAAELEADLEEAEAEGVSAEEVLGSGAFDPRSFATAWAAERGVVQRLPPKGHRLAQTSRMVAVIGGFALLAVIGGMLVIVAPSSGPTLLAPVGLSALVDPGPTVVRLAARPPGVLNVTVDGVSATAASCAPKPHRCGQPERLRCRHPHRRVGILLTIGVAGALPFTLLWLWAGVGPASHRRVHT